MENTINHNEIDLFVFKHPFTCILAGPSKSGKTTLIQKILNQNSVLIDKPPTKIVYCYSVWQPIFDYLQLQEDPKIEFNKGLPDFDQFDSNENNLLVLDDLMQECGQDDSICKMFTVDSHHKNVSVFFLVQNIFSKQKIQEQLVLTQII